MPTIPKLFALLSLSALAAPAPGNSDDLSTTGHASGFSLLAGEYEHSEAGTVGWVTVAVLLIIVGMVLGILGAEPLGKGERTSKNVGLVAGVAALGLVILLLPLNTPIWLAVYYVLNGLVCFVQFKKGQLGIE